MNVKGYVTDFGGLTSHAAIVARSLNIPAVVGLHDATNRIKEGDLLIIDGYKGEVIINPDVKQLNDYQKKIARLQKQGTELNKLRGLPAVTLDGKEIQLLANLELTDEIELISQCGAKDWLVRLSNCLKNMKHFRMKKNNIRFTKLLQREFIQKQ